MIVIEIQEGQLINGSIDPESVRWNPAASRPPKDGPKYLSLSHAQRSVNLDNIIVPPGSVVSGVKFGIKDDRLTLMVAGLSLHDESMNYNLIDKPEKVIWYSSTNSNR